MCRPTMRWVSTRTTLVTSSISMQQPPEKQLPPHFASVRSQPSIKLSRDAPACTRLEVVSAWWTSLTMGWPPQASLAKFVTTFSDIPAPFQASIRALLHYSFLDREGGPCTADCKQ